MISVSVLIPAFNAAATLNATIESVVRQTYADWEAIIIDDGSTDSTALNAQAWSERDPRIKLVKGPNHGLAGARNEAARNAIAPWLLFLDADDLIVPTYLSMMLAATKYDPRPDLVYCAVARIASDGRIGTPEIAAHTEYFVSLASYNPFPVHTCLVRQTTFDTFGGFDTALQTCEDWDLWQRFARAGVVFASVDDCLAHYRMRFSSLTHNAERVHNGARQVILRGHGRDSRVRDPLPAYAEGLPLEQAGQAIVGNAIWCAGMLIGSGKNCAAFLGQVDIPPLKELHIDVAISPILGGVPAGACKLQEDWPLLWPIHKNSIHDALLIVEQRCGISEYASRCMLKLEQELRATPGCDEARQAPTILSQETAVPSVGEVRFGDLGRSQPISTNWGSDRGTPIDRHYIESFLRRHRGDIRGRVLEIGDNTYTVRFGGNQVSASDVLHVKAGTPNATIVADLADAKHIESDSFDCIILTQTLHLIFDIRAALRTLVRILKPGGVLLLTVPGISQLDHGEWNESWFWSMTVASVNQLLVQSLPPDAVDVESRGNVLAATAFLQGLSQEDLPPLWHEIDDLHYPVTILARAIKPDNKPPARTISPSLVDKARTKPVTVVRNRAMTQPPIILMYHRVGSISCDPWHLGVTPEHLAEQLAWLSSERSVVPLSWLVSELKRGQTPGGAVALTFDDGYADVLINGKPILEKHDCPATMFITTGAIGKNRVFWWDVLARIVLETPSLPDQLTLEIRSQKYCWRLSDNNKPISGRSACDLIPRSELHRSLWRVLKPLRPDERQPILEDLAAWASTDTDARERDRSLTADEVCELFESGFMDIGAHTVTHASLPLLSEEMKQWEAAESRRVCEELTGSGVRTFSYPFGDLDDTCTAAVRKAGFQFACTTSEGSINSTDDLLRLPRMLVRNWDQNEFCRKVMWRGEQGDLPRGEMLKRRAETL